MTEPDADATDIPTYADDRDDADDESREVDDPGADPKGLTPPRNPFGGGPAED